MDSKLCELLVGDWGTRIRSPQLEDAVVAAGIAEAVLDTRQRYRLSELTPAELLNEVRVQAVKSLDDGIFLSWFWPTQKTLDLLSPDQAYASITRLPLRLRIEPSPDTKFPQLQLVAQALAAEPREVSSFVGDGGLDWRYRLVSWPLRIGFATDDESHHVRDALGYAFHYHNLVELVDEGPCDIFVTGAPASRLASGGLALAPGLSSDPGPVLVVAVGEMDIEPEKGYELARSLITATNAGGIHFATVHHANGAAWLNHLIEQLSHDEPIDRALRAADRSRFNLGFSVLSDRTVETLRLSNIVEQICEWFWAQDDLLIEPTSAMQEQLPDFPLAPRITSGEIADYLSAHAKEFRYDHERKESTGIADTVRAAGGFPNEVMWGSAAMAAPMTPPAAEPPPATRSLGAEPGVPDLERERRLRLRLRRSDDSLVIDDATGTGTLSYDEILKLSVAIAAEQLPGSVGANAAFPKFEEDLSLDVAIYIAGIEDRMWVRSLYLPQSADSRFTDDITFRCPPYDLEVLVAVLRSGRPLQTAKFWMSVDSQGARPEFTVDQPGPLSDAWRQRAAAAALASVPGSDGPKLIALSNGARSMATSEEFTRSFEQVKAVLRGGFNLSSGELADKTAVLAQLARLGRTLYTKIGGDLFASAQWIHVVDYALAELPLEIIYSHDIGPEDEVIGICPEAASGADECRPDCPSKNREDVVCPNAFWASSKVIERRSHVAGRVRRQAARRRQIRVTAPAAIALSALVDNVDHNAVTELVKAIGQLAPNSERAGNWEDLEGKVSLLRPHLIVLVPHTQIDRDAPPPDDQELEIGNDFRPVDQIKKNVVNVDLVEPGPLVFAIGCNTEEAAGGFANLTQTLHEAGAEAVITAISPVPGAEVSRFMVTLCDELETRFRNSGNGQSLADVMRAARRAALRKGNLMSLALAMSGDGEVVLVP